MKMKCLILFVLACSFLNVYSQAEISFKTRLHDFGTIKEVNGAVAYNFEFTNVGNAPVLIKNVESSCGCTSPEWSKQPILPGKSGFVKATFDPKDRPGHFDKTITVYANAKTSVIELKIKGTVEGKARTILDDYPYELPSGLRLPLDHISLMKVVKGQTKNMSIGVYNNSGRKVSVAFGALPSHLKMRIEPQQIDVKKTAMIYATYNSAMKGEYGRNEDIVEIMVDGKKYNLPVSIFIEEDFSSVDKAVAPAVEINKSYYNFGSTASAQPAQFVYTITNTGKTAVKIHRLYTNDKRVSVVASENEIQPGKTIQITAKTNIGAEAGKLSCLVSVITNCPQTPEVNLRFYGEIK